MDDKRVGALNEIEDTGKNMVELIESYAVITLPKHTLEVVFEIVVGHNGEVLKVRRTMTIDEVRNAFKEAEDLYIPDDAVFRPTDKALRELGLAPEEIK